MKVAECLGLFENIIKSEDLGLTYTRKNYLINFVMACKGLQTVLIIGSWTFVSIKPNIYSIDLAMTSAEFSICEQVMSPFLRLVSYECVNSEIGLISLESTLWCALSATKVPKVVWTAFSTHLTVYSAVYRGDWSRLWSSSPVKTALLIYVWYVNLG